MLAGKVLLIMRNLSYTLTCACVCVCPLISKLFLFLIGFPLKILD